MRGGWWCKSKRLPAATLIIVKKIYGNHNAGKNKTNLTFYFHNSRPFTQRNPNLQKPDILDCAKPSQKGTACVRVSVCLCLELMQNSREVVMGT